MASEPPLIIEVEGLKELQEALKQFGEEWEPIASRALTPGLAILVSYVHEKALSDRGTTAASVASQIERTAGSEIIGKVGSSIEGAPNILEFGRKAGRMPPPKRLEEWAGLHGMEGLGFVIARAIGARGWKTPAPHTLSKAVRERASAVVKAFEEGIVAELRRLKLKD
jgi:hypothetical protein